MNLLSRSMNPVPIMLHNVSFETSKVQVEFQRQNCNHEGNAEVSFQHLKYHFFMLCQVFFSIFFGERKSNLYLKF